MVVLSTVLLTGCSKPGSSPEGGDREGNKLSIYSRGECVDEDATTQFGDEIGMQVVYDVLEAGEEIYPVIETGVAKHDIVCPSDYMIQYMIKSNLLVELSFDSIPNHKGAGQQYPDIFKGFDPENKYSVPYYWEATGIPYNARRLEELGVPAPTRWYGLWDECSSGETPIQNSVRNALTVAPKMEGYSLNSTSSDELAQARDLLIEQKLLVQAYVIDQIRDRMIGGEVAVSVACFGGVLCIQDAVAEQGLDYSLEYVTPKEGISYWIDSWIIPANAEHKKNVKEWIDFLCRPDIVKKNSEYIIYATPNTGAYNLLDDGLKNSKTLFPDLDELPNCEVIQYPRDDMDTIYNDVWGETKPE